MASGNLFWAKWYENPVLKNSRTLMEHFKANGYRVVGSGKMMHHHRASDWDAYPHKADNPIPKLARLIVQVASTELDKGTAHFDPSTLAVSTFDVRGSRWSWGAFTPHSSRKRLFTSRTASWWATRRESGARWWRTSEGGAYAVYTGRNQRPFSVGSCMIDPSLPENPT